MRSLILSGIGRMVEAHAQIKKVLFKNMGNFTCWHVMGILNRKDKDYDAARRAYLQALKCNANNESVMRDLCQLQMHLRDYTGFKETRRLLLLKHPDEMECWTAYATSCYLSGDLENCISSVTSIMRFEAQVDQKPMRPNHKLEVVVLAVKTMERMGNYQKAIEFLNENNALFVDHLQREELTARLFAKMGFENKAIDHYENLLEFNSCNYETYYAILQTKGLKLFDDFGKQCSLNDEDKQTIKDSMNKYKRAFPKVNAH